MELTRRDKTLATVGVLFGIFLAAIEGTVVATAIPTAMGSLGGLTLIHYVFTSYQLSATGSILIWGKLADLWGLRRSYLLGCLLFLAGSALCGISQNSYELLAARFLQGLGAGAIYPIAQTTLGLIYTEIKRAKMQVYLSLVWAIASTIGPPVGAVLTENLSWRWVFYLNLPAGFLSLALVHAGLKSYQRDISAEPLGKAFDWKGSILFSLGLTAILLALSVDRNGKFLWSWPAMAALIALSATLGASFLSHLKRASHPFVSSEILKNPVLRRAGLGSFIMCIAAFGTTSYIPLYCQLGLRQSIGAAGRTLTVFLFGWILASSISPRAYIRYSLRTLARLGAIVMALTYWYLGFHLEGVSSAQFRISLFVLGAGMGICFAPILLGVQSIIPKREMGSGTSTLQLLRSLGGLFGVTLIGTLLALDLNGFSPLLGGESIHENPHLAMTRVFLLDAILLTIASITFWKLPATLPKN